MNHMSAFSAQLEVLLKFYITISPHLTLKLPCIPSK